MGNETLRVGFVVKMKHGHLLEAVRRRGWSQRQAAEFLGVDESTFGRIINLQWMPKEFPEAFAERLFELTGKLPEELFPEFARNKAFLEAEKIRDFYVNATSAMLRGTALPILPPAPDEAAFELEKTAAIEEVLRTLPERLARVIRLRFFEEKTLEEAGSVLGVTRERVRQMESRALRFLRHPSRTRKLRGVTDWWRSGLA